MLLVNNMSALGKTLTLKELNSKILTCLVKDYRPKTCAIIESKDLNVYPKGELIGSLMTYEVEMNMFKTQDEALKKEKKTLVLQVAKVLSASKNKD